MKRFIQAGLQAAIEIVLLLPILIIVNHWGAEKAEMIRWLCSVWLFYMAGFLIVPVMKKMPFRIGLALQLIVSFGYSMMLSGFSFIGMTLGIAAIAALNRGMAFREHKWSELMSSSAFGISILIYFGSLVLFFLIPSLNPYLSWIRLFGSITAILSPFAINGLLLQQESSYYEEAKVALSVRRFNVFVTLSFVAIVLIIGFSGITQKFEQWAKEMISAWLSKFTQAPPYTEPETRTPQFDDSGFYSEPSMFDQLITLILYLLGAVLTIILCYFFLKWSYRALIQLLIKIKNYRGDRQLAEFGYEDEESVIEWTKLRHKQLLPKKKRKHRWYELQTNRQRIRYLYREAVWKAAKLGTDFKAALTPLEWGDRVKRAEQNISRETTDVLTATYNRARYNGEEPDDDTIRRLYNDILS